VWRTLVILRKLRVEVSENLRDRRLVIAVGRPEADSGFNAYPP
jgi:hypothetical protein